MRRELHLDAVIVGAGTAGLTAATRLAESGARVCVVAKGIGCTHLAPGTVDVLGYAPEAVDCPSHALAEFVAQRPDHPYALVGLETVAAAVAWLARKVNAGQLAGYAYVGADLERNRRLPTALGVLRPSAAVPGTMTAGELEVGERVCIVGFRSLRDFHARLCASTLARSGREARFVELDPVLERADQNALGLARRFEDPAWRARLCAELAPRLRGDERVGVPAVLGLSDPHGVHSDVERRLGRPVFEIPTLPPSVPGMRLFEILRSALRAAGGRLVLGSEVVGAERAGDRVTAVHARTAGGERRYMAPWIVLASGGFASGAVELDSHWQAHERALGLPLTGVPGPGQPRFAERYLDEQPVSRAGVALGDGLLAEGVDNVLVAGAALPGAVPWREGSGEGIALSTGYAAAATVVETEAAHAEARA